MIVTGTSPNEVDAMLDAISAAGAHCAITNAGHGRFKPSELAKPHVGEANAINKVDEIRIETFCDRVIVK